MRHQLRAPAATKVRRLPPRQRRSAMLRAKSSANAPLENWEFGPELLSIRNCFFSACNPKLDQSFIPASSLGPMQNLHSEKRLISLYSISKRFTDFLQTTARGTGHLIWAPGQH